MSKTSFAKAYRDQILTNISIAYMNSATDYVADKVAPFVKVEQDSGQIYSYGKQALRILDDEKATGGTYNKVKYTVEKTDHYVLKNYGYTTDVLEEDVENAESPLNPETDATEMLTSQLLTAREKRLAGAINTTNITQNVSLSGTSRWSDYSGTSNPFTNIEAGIKAIRNATGKMANSLVLSFDSVVALKHHPKIIERFRNVAIITDDMIKEAFASIFGIRNVYFALAMELPNNTPTEGNLSSLWDKKALLYYSEKPTLKSTSFMKTYAKRDGIEVTKVAQANLAVEALEGDVYSKVRVRTKYDQVMVDTGAAYLIDSTTA